MLAGVDHLSANPRVSALPTHDASVSVQTPTSKVAELLDERPVLPGVIVKDGDRIAGVVSREQLRAQLSHKFGLEVFARRPVELLLDRIQPS
jgi:hypothetical protein